MAEVQLPGRPLRAETNVSSDRGEMTGVMRMNIKMLAGMAMVESGYWQG